MQIRPGSWILDAAAAAPKRSATRDDTVPPVKPVLRPEAFTPPPTQGRGLLIDLIV